MSKRNGRRWKRLKLRPGESYENYILRKTGSSGQSWSRKGAMAVGKAAARQAGKQAAKQAGKAGARQAAKTALRGNVFTAVGALVVEQGVDSVLLSAGKIDEHEYKCRSASNVGAAAGGLGGAAAGAAIGTAILPGVGTIIGGLLGGMLGGTGGAMGGRALVE